MRKIEKAEPQRLLLTSIESADVLAISPRKLWALTAAGEIPCVRIGRAVRYSVEDLRRWIAQQADRGEA